MVSGWLVGSSREDSNSDAPCTVGDQRCGVVMPMPRMAQVWWAEAAEGLTRVAEGTQLQINLCRCPLGGCRIVQAKSSPGALATAHNCYMW